MNDCKIYPADTVDIYGNVWPTIGENIRNGILGENLKAGYVNIDKGIFTSTYFNIIKIDQSSFKINNINCLFIFPEKIKIGGANFSFSNTPKFCTIRNAQPLTDMIMTIKIIYKDSL